MQLAPIYLFNFCLLIAQFVICLSSLPLPSTRSQEKEEDFLQHDEDGIPIEPALPRDSELLNKRRALESLTTAQPDCSRVALANVYDYWCSKRRSIGGPLLPHLWYEQPYKTTHFAYLMRDGRMKNLPFAGNEPAHAIHRAPSRRRLNGSTAYDILFGIRRELELVRTLADQVMTCSAVPSRSNCIMQSSWLFI